jgi:U3 small nucleolar RNA-associated protein 14
MVRRAVVVICEDSSDQSDSGSGSDEEEFDPTDEVSGTYIDSLLYLT